MNPDNSRPDTTAGQALANIWFWFGTVSCGLVFAILGVFIKDAAEVGSVTEITRLDVNFTPHAIVIVFAVSCLMHVSAFVWLVYSKRKLTSGHWLVRIPTWDLKGFDNGMANRGALSRRKSVWFYLCVVVLAPLAGSAWLLAVISSSEAYIMPFNTPGEHLAIFYALTCVFHECGEISIGSPYPAGFSALTVLLAFAATISAWFHMAIAIWRGLSRRSS